MARRARLEAAQREAVHGNAQDGERRPKAPPSRIHPPHRMTSRTPTVNIQQLRESVRRNEERQRQNAVGCYGTPPGPNYQRDREHLAKLEEDERQKRQAEAEEEVRQREIAEEREALQASVQRLEAEASVPKEVIAQVQAVQVKGIPEIPAIPAETAEVVNSSTSGSTSAQTSSRSSKTRRLQQVDEDDENYWKNIYEVMCNTWLDEKGLTTADELHEGVLYWMTLKDINTLIENSKRGIPEAEKRMENYYVEMDILQEVLKKKYEDNYRKLEDTEEFKTARESGDDVKIKELYYKLFDKLRELRCEWGTEKIAKDKRILEERGVQESSTTRRS
eukprot:6110017-Amphidinium_carterae.1